ncbi:amidase [Algoriphagus namhaensis]|uniref:Amidase n=1 Tax=Algoriphagus namhaensis TaxID=915353 RepID=A0ABV8AR71_9BACT
MKKHFLVPVLLLIWASCSSPRITKSDIRHAQKIFGMEFTAEQISTMQDYLNSNLEGYDSMRLNPPRYEVIPALTFSPMPSGFEIKDSPSVVDFDFNEKVLLPENREDLAFYTVADLSVLIKTKQISSVELTQFFLDRIKKYDEKLEAVITITEERALAQATKMDEELAQGKYRGPLHGIPYGTKDLMAVKDYPTTWGAEPYRDQVIDETATVVEKLDDAGAVLIAKLVSGALARGDVWFGGKTKNPWDLTQGASGSSAGSGSATSAGLVPFALGTETLGSITSPANRNGVTGLRPTYGRVSRKGVMSLSWSMDKIGPLCRSAADCALVFDAIHGTDPKDPMTIAAPFSYSNTSKLEGAKIGYFKEVFENDSSLSKDNNLAMLDSIRNMGFELIELELPKTISTRGFDIILRAEAGAFFDELVLSGETSSMVEQGKSSRANSLRQSRFIPAVEYLQANRQRRVMIEAIHPVFSSVDVILSPTNYSKQLVITNLSGHPALTIPTGLDSKNHPTSITLLGNLFEEQALLEFGTLIQEKTDFHLKKPPGFE